MKVRIPPVTQRHASRPSPSISAAIFWRLTDVRAAMYTVR